MPDHFRARTARTPDAVALVADDGVRTTYAELDAASDRLARYLTRHGAGPGRLAAVVMERSPETITALLAVLKTGGAYLPVDVGYPAARIELMLRDAAPALLLTTSDLVERLPRSTGGPDRVVLDAPSVRDAVAGEDAVPTATSPHPDSAAYTIYTSGSTGIPKGVVATHRAVDRLVRPADYADLRAGDDVVSHLGSVSFDSTTFDIWATLLNGATLAVGPAGSPSVADIRDYLARHRVTVALLPTGLLHQVIDLDVEALRGVRSVLTGGEALSVEHCRTLLDALPGTRLMNGYGPTESVTYTHTHPPSPARTSTAAGRSRWAARWPAPAPTSSTPPCGPSPSACPASCTSRATPRPRLREPSGPERRTVHRLPVRGRRRPDVPHRRPRAVAGRRGAGVRRPGRRPGQDRRFPRRTRGGGGHRLRPPRRGPGRGRGPRGHPRRQAPRRLRGTGGPRRLRP
ncbi:AMP-binding protein [Streptomyces sp. GKU 257-1]|nr:AMP-binding protein [Streptomyces sp. GKU 257-1]